MEARQFIAMALMAVGWSGGWIASKVAAVNIPPFTLSAVRFLAAGVLLLVLVRLTSSHVPRSSWPELLLMSAIGIVGYSGLVFLGLRVATASDASVIVTALTPVLAAVLAVPVAREPMTRAKLIGLACSLMGVFLIVVEGSIVAEEPIARLTANLLVIGGTICWAFYTLLAKRVLQSASPLAVTAVTTTAGGLMLIPLGVLEGGFTSIASWSVDGWTALFYLVVVSTMIGIWYFCRLVAQQGAAQAAMALFLVPVGTLYLSAVLLGESVTLQQSVGAGLAILGVRVATLGRAEREQPRPGSL